MWSVTAPLCVTVTICVCSFRRRAGILDDAMEDTGETSLLLDSAEQRIFDIRQGKALKGLSA